MSMMMEMELIKNIEKEKEPLPLTFLLYSMQSLLLLRRFPCCSQVTTLNTPLLSLRKRTLPPPLMMIAMTITRQPNDKTTTLNATTNPDNENKNENDATKFNYTAILIAWKTLLLNTLLKKRPPSGSLIAPKYDASILDMANTCIEFSYKGDEDSDEDDFSDAEIIPTPQSLCPNQNPHPQWPQTTLFPHDYGLTPPKLPPPPLNPHPHHPHPLLPPISIINPTPIRFITPQTYLLHHLFEHQADATPNAIAIRFLSKPSHKTITYSPDHLANRLARHLRSLTTIHPDNIIPVLLHVTPCCPEIGRRVPPLAHDMPLERVEFIVEEVGAKVVVFNKELKGMFMERVLKKGWELKVVVVDEVMEQLEELSGERLELDNIQSNHLAYIEYTSGSTGRPKGTMIEHGSITDSLLAHKPYLNWTPESRFLQFASITFDVSIFEIFFPWAVGMCVWGGSRCHVVGFGGCCE
ncbi:hypothetical protein BC829DRAFT_421258 [Chytridium lagenaria]|nr:hypothetical protein BC829DRAFT_421258 [Chytridium lagenaria]